MLSRIEGFIRRHGLIAPGGRVLVGVSGGVDSVVLLHVLKALGYQAVVAHVNYGLRKEASDQDAEFVQALAREMGLPCAVQTADTHTYAKAHGLSKQVAARQLRYAFFAEQAHIFDCPVVALGHHADDQLETVLWNLVKGTGLAGFRGMLPKRGQFIRPMLAVTRQDITSYAQTQRLTWREDATNQQPVYTRNQLRLQVVPLLRALNPHVAANMVTTTARVRFAEALLRQFLEKTREQMVESPPGVWQLPLASFQPFPEPGVGLYHLLQPHGITMVQAQQVWDTRQESAPRCFVFPNGYQVWVQAGKGWLLAPGAGQPATGEHLITNSPFTLEIGHATLKGTTLPNDGTFQLLKDPWVFQGDADQIRYPLQLRIWQPGDSMQPLGMQGHKKISDLLNEAKWPVVHRARLWVLLSEREIVWAAGLRIAESAKVGSHTKNVLQIRLTERI